MQNFLNCWLCKHFIWFSANNNNSFALCDIKNRCILANEKVCEHFVLGNGVHTKREIPDNTKNN